MKRRLMKIAVLLTCHTIIPLCLTLAGFWVLAVLTEFVIPGIIWWPAFKAWERQVLEKEKVPVPAGVPAPAPA